MKRILVALSGGVDSAVAALTLKKQGYDVSCAYIKTWMNETGSDIFADCPWEQDAKDARSVAELLGLDFEIVNLINDYKERVVQYLVDGYKMGITPNPDIMCNREMKFGVFLDYALNKDFDGIATGHYCRKRTKDDGTCDLLEGVDGNKDQSYFLSLITQKQLSKVLFPIGEMEKPKVREIANSHNLPNAKKKDSQGICFLGRVSINDFLAQYLPESPGDIVTTEGNVVGQHKGLYRYTLGQRRGIGVPSNTDNEAFVVVSKDLDKNQLIVGFDKPTTPGLYTDNARIYNLSFINKPIIGEQAIMAKTRYRDPATPIIYKPQADGSVDIQFKEQQRALAPGQIMALYKDGCLLGGGVYL